MCGHSKIWPTMAGGWPGLGIKTALDKLTNHMVVGALATRRGQTLLSGTWYANLQNTSFNICEERTRDAFSDHNFGNEIPCVDAK